MPAGNGAACVSPATREDCVDPSKILLEDVIAGLRSRQKTLPCKYFYDAKGAELFEEICALEEYYPTRTELAIMEEHARAMARRIGSRSLLIEYGSGSSRKTRVLLSALESPAAYVPIDISREALLTSAESIAKQYPELEVLPVVADYLAPVHLPQPGREARRRVIYFPGSTIGNFETADAVAFLDRVARQAGEGGGVLIGVDLKKNPAELIRAYDDSKGVTAAFNRNLLVRINRELGGDFCERDFRHEARWNAHEGRIEMHLVSSVACSVRIAGEEIRFEAGESIHTENSYKYELDEFESLAAKAGLVRSDVWMDARRRFTVQYYEVAVTRR